MMTRSVADYLGGWSWSIRSPTAAFKDCEETLSVKTVSGLYCSTGLAAKLYYVYY